MPPTLRESDAQESREGVARSVPWVDGVSPG